MLASTFMDMVLGVDIHFEMVPMPAPVPTPLPNPFVGMVYDPAGLLTGQAMSLAMALVTGTAPKGPVLINFMPATVCGTNAKNSLGVPHILMPPGTAWAPMPKLPKPAIKGPPPPPGPPVAPEGDAISVFGSQTVQFMGSSAVRMGDKSMSCGEPVRLPSSTVLAIPKGLPVMVGGPPALSISDAVGALLKSKWVAGYLHDLLSRMAPGRLRNILSKVVCFVTGHPVDVATGRVLTDHVDFELPGPLPLKFERNYASSWANRAGPLGHGWSHSLDQAVWAERGKVVYLDAEGRELEFDTFDFPDHVLPAGQSVFDPISNLTLKSLGHRRFEITTREGLTSTFEPVPGATGARQWWSRITRQAARTGATIDFEYDRAANLAWVKDSAGRQIAFEHDRAGRLTAVKLPHPAQHGWEVHTRYAYDEAGDLARVTDPLGNSWKFAYKQHLLVQETNRNGLSFYFAYDGHGEDAYCVRTWGDGGIYDHIIDYDKLGKVTCVTNSLGHTTTYKMNVVGCVTEVMDPLGGTTKYEYDERTLRKIKETNPVGGETSWTYDARGNLIKVVQPDETVLALKYSPDNLLAEVQDLLGNLWSWTYDRLGRVTSRLDPLGRRTTFHYEQQHLAETVEATGLRTRLSHDAAGNLTAAETEGSGQTRRRFDQLGRCIEVRGFSGYVETRTYDQIGRLVTTTDSRGITRTFRHDPEGNIVAARDGNNEMSFEYVGLRWRTKITRAGQSIRFSYDTEGKLTGVHNEIGREWRLVRGPTGEIDEEIDYDGGVRRFLRDAAGRVVRLIRPDGSEQKCRYDEMGRLAGVEYSTGGGGLFKYRADGRLVEAINQHAKVVFERDELGRVVRELQDEHWVGSEYDQGGWRTGVASSRGFQEQITRNSMGDVSVLSATTESNASPFDLGFTRDRFGFEVTRAIPGGISQVWERDDLSKPVARRVLAGARELEAEAYAWGPGGRLNAVIDAFAGPTTYQRDVVGNLTSAAYPDHTAVIRETDEVGRLFRSPQRDDRTYGAAGQVVEARGDGGNTHCDYDRLGNLTRKTAPDGTVSDYQWAGNGMLKAVTRPDGSDVELRYDALGRRIWKRVGDRVTRWVWDGNVPLHEWREPSAGGQPAGTGADVEGPVTWLFEPESFAPIGKLVGDRAYAILTDHRGVPRSMYGANGQRVWSGEVDAYGDLKPTLGERKDCPFRWPGQYDDVDLDLTLNRFRYYDPDLGTFISADPLRLMGGSRPYAHVSDPLRMADVLGLNPDDLALGLSTKRVTVDTPNGPITGVQPGVLQDFAKDPVGDGSIKASTWTSLEEVVDENGLVDLEQTIRKGMDDAERIHFNVDGMTNWKDIVANPDPSAFRPPSTNWELATVMSDAELKAKTTVYDGPGNPVKCG